MRKDASRWIIVHEIYKGDKVKAAIIIVPSSIFENEAQKQDFIEYSRKEGLEPVIREMEKPVR